MKSTLYLLHYNNYYNRIVKKEDTLDDYLEYMIGDAITGVNFNPNNFISTTQVINWQYSDPDYCIVVDENGDIDSRWFVVATNRTKINQYQIELQRDVLVDFYEPVTNATCMIRRATLDSGNDLIFNRENVSFNQIKMREDKLYDATGTSWIVGYMPANSQLITGSKKLTITPTAAGPISENYSYVKNLQDNPVKILQDWDIESYWVKTPSPTNIQEYHMRRDSVSFSNRPSSWTPRYEYQSSISSTLNNSLLNISYNLRDNWENQIANTLASVTPGIDSFMSRKDWEALKSEYNNAIVHNSEDGKYYKVTISDQYISSIGSGEYHDIQTIDPRLAEEVNDSILAINGVTLKNSSRVTYIRHEGYKYSIVKMEVIDLETVDIQFSSTLNKLEDAPYYMFCLPMNDTNLQYTMEIGRQGSSNIYDLQILPYCPFRDWAKNGISDDRGTVSRDYINIVQGSSTVGYIYFCSKSNFTFNIDYVVNIENYKLENECDMYRLCSPNGNGQFEFSAAMNGGIEFINVDCTYRPINPYIHLNPNFGRLYGSDFNDFRGLTLGGDFSIPMVSDQWAAYETQNKNYQNIFDREIQNLKLQQKMERINQGVSIATGAVSGAASGAMAGSIFGPVGIGVGAAIGGVTSAIGGGVDYALSEQLRAEQLSFKTDMFNYNLQNIQALPYSISKTGCMTFNNKLVPYIEYYSCSDKEKATFINTLKYHGMTVNAIGTISEYLQPAESFIAADIIRIEDIQEDSHVIAAIANELSKGVFI